MAIFGKKANIALVAVIIALMLTVCALLVPVNAVTTDTLSYTIEEIDAYLEKNGEEYYAYMILDEVEESLRPIILEARWRIISNTTWIDDELNGHIEDEMGNIIEVVPHFHEIFPEDWEIQPGRSLY